MKKEQQFSSLFNMIIYCEKEEQVQFFDEIIRTVTSKFPCQIILIKADLKSKTAHLEVISEKVKSSEENSEVECEEVKIQVAGQDLERIPFLILTHLAPDLPIYVIFGKDPSSSNQVLSTFKQLADHLILDSEYAENLHDFSGLMLEWKDRAPCRIVDMNWVRFSGWRHVLLQAFDTKERVDALQNSEQIVIEYNQKKSGAYTHCDVQAIYLQAWLASQLKWNFQSIKKENGSKIYSYKHEKHSITVRIINKEIEKFSPGAIVSFQTSTNDDTTRLVRKEENPSVVFAEIASKEACQLPFAIPLFTMTKGLSFIKQLLFTPTSPHYYKMLEIVSKI